ncbi:hypothetical protein JTB14_010980 [Gonioctena quinquepunctata]|nr:hypothetical protein JTB14_010980 [Gonioctena quinquepunctata]
MLLEEKQISETLEKTIDDFTDDRSKNEFSVKDSKAKSMFVQCITDKHLDLVKDSKSSKEMMKALQDVFERKSVFTKLTLKKKLLTLKLKRNEKLEDHFLIFDTLIRDLESAGSKLEEEDKVCHLLLSLNEEFESVITAIETMNSTTVSMDFVKSRLLDEELKIKAKFESNGGHSEMSFTASPYTCYKCGKRGHKIADCRQSTTRGNFRGRRGYNRGFHRSNRGQGSTQNNNQGQSSIQANKADEIAFIALCSSTGSNRDINKFILDSGCTQHMVMDELEKCMSEITELKSEVKIGTAKDNEILYARKQGIIRGICQGKEIKIQALIVKGIALEYTLPYTPQENGTAERMNRSLLDKVRTKFAETNLPRELWGEAILCSAYELNRSPTEANGGETPAQRWYKKNDLSKLRVFGSQAWAVILPRQSKLEKRAQPCIMVGYTGAGYRLWNYEKNEIISSRDVRFNERNTNYNEILKNTKDEDSRKIIQIQEDLTDRINEIDIEENKLNENRQDDSESTSSDNFEECLPKINETNRGRKINPPKYLEEYEVYTAYCLISSSKSDPLTYEDAVKDKEWKEAIEKELNSHTKLNTWTEAELPEGKTAIQTRWVFRTKEDGTKKARVVAKGFQLKEENSFESVYSPVARLSTIRLLLSVALEKDYNI